jgi:hypothetical protein
VSPTHFRNAEAPGGSIVPFASLVTPYRALQIHDDVGGRAMRIGSMSFRRTGQSTTLYQPFSITVDVWCSTAVTNSTAPNTLFDSNHGNDKLRVVTNKVINFPQTEHAFVPSDFVYTIPFDSAFLYAGTGPLCWEVQLTARTNPAEYNMDAITQGPNLNPPKYASRYGVGCVHTGRANSMGAAGGSSMNWGMGTGTLSIAGTEGPANGIVLVVLGFSSASFAGLPLPFLVPGSATSPSGSCHLYSSVNLIFAASTDQAGASTTNVPVPATLDLHALRSFEQIWALDAAANPTGLVTSNGVNHNWVAPFATVPVARVYASGNLGPTGLSNTAYGVVMRFNP